MESVGQSENDNSAVSLLTLLYFKWVKRDTALIAQRIKFALKMPLHGV